MVSPVVCASATSTSCSTDSGCQSVVVMPLVAPATDVVDRHRQELAVLTQELGSCRRQIDSLNRQLEFANRLSYRNITSQPNLVLHYTGLSNEPFDVVVSLVETVQPITYYLGWAVVCLNTADQLLMALVKLRRNYTHIDLRQRFSVSPETVKNVILTMICVLHRLLFDGVLNAVGVPSQVKNLSSLPRSFADFSNCRCTEVQISVPRSDMSKQNRTWSYYKQRNTYKGLIGVAPYACVT